MVWFSLTAVLSQKMAYFNKNEFSKLSLDWCLTEFQFLRLPFAPHTGEWLLPSHDFLEEPFPTSYRLPSHVDGTSRSLLLSPSSSPVSWRQPFQKSLHGGGCFFEMATIFWASAVVTSSLSKWSSSSLLSRWPWTATSLASSLREIWSLSGSFRVLLTLVH